MFIRKSSHGYYRGTEQVSGRGDYLALFSWNDYKALDEVRAQCATCTELTRVRNAGIDAWNDDPLNPANDRNAYNWPAVCPAHGGIRSGLQVPSYPNGKPKLWAIVRSCSLHQCGHFMMGAIRIGGTRIGVSGPCGSDGLPLDYQAVPVKYRHLLTEVPEEIARVYWTDDGHNDIGSAGPTLREWALTLPRRS